MTKARACVKASEEVVVSGEPARGAIANRGRDETGERASPDGTAVSHLQRTSVNSHQEEMPRVHVTRKRMLLFAAFVLAALAFLYLVLPQLGGVRHTWDRLNDGDSWWIAIAVLLQLLSMASYIAIFQGVHVPPGSPITWRQSYQITMAGLAAT
jgi:hypothetical protein